MSAYVHKQIYVRMLSAAIFKVEITQVSINRRMGSKKVVYLCYGILTAMKRNKPLIDATTWMNLKKKTKMNLKKISWKSEQWLPLWGVVLTGKGHRELSEVIAVFCILIQVIITWLYTHVKKSLSYTLKICSFPYM